MRWFDGLLTFGLALSNCVVICALIEMNDRVQKMEISVSKLERALSTKADVPPPGRLSAW